MIQPHYSLIIFIGRDPELQQFQKIIQNSQKDPKAPWVLTIQGAGGIGKTQLLYQFIRMAEGLVNPEDRTPDPDSLEQDFNSQTVLPYQTSFGTSVILTHSPVDLYLTTHQTLRGLLRGLAVQLNRTAPGDPFRPFFGDLDRSFRTSDNNLDLETSFIECYQTLQADNIILLFDTIEQINPAVEPFFSKTLPHLKESQPGTIVVAAGRKPLDHFCDRPGMLHLELAGLERDEIRNYFQKLLPNPRYPLTPEFIDRIVDLSGGRPILVALTVDWLNYGKKPEELEAEKPEEFERAMIQRISELRKPEDQVILAMAHLKRRFNSGFLAYILEKSIEEADALINSLTRFSFIKSHYDENDRKTLISCVLHDEMQRLIIKYVWPIYDPEGDLRQEWSERILVYYDRLIKDAEMEERRPLYPQVLKQERLYYTLLANADRGVMYWQTLLHSSPPPDFQEAINQEVQEFESVLDLADRQELISAWASSAYDRNRYRDALNQWESLKAQAPLSRPLEGKIRSKLIYCYSHLDDYERSIALGLETVSWFQNILNSPTLPSDERILLETSYGSSLNALGWTYRQRDQPANAIDYYQKSLAVLEKIPGTESDRASTKINLGYVYHLMGKDREAVAHGKGALKLSQHSGNRKKEGFTQNVLGIIAANSLREQQAVRHFHAARLIFEEIDEKRGLAMVNIAYGRLYRQIGWYKVKPDRGTQNAAQSNYAKASDMLKEAVSTIQRSSQTILAEIYNEQGTLQREQGDYEGALELYQKSQKIAHQIEHKSFQADNAQDLGVTYYLQGDLDRAYRVSLEAIEIAKKMPSPHLIGRAKRTVSNVLFKRKKYEESLNLAFESYIELLTLDPFSVSNTPAIKEILNEEWLTWMTEDLLESIEEADIQIKLCRQLLRRWEITPVEGVLVSDLYPGLGIVLRDLLDLLDDSDPSGELR